MAGADEPATLSGLCQAMAIAMVGGRRSSGQRRLMFVVVVEGAKGRLSALMITRFWSIGPGIPIGRRNFSHQRATFPGAMQFVSSIQAEAVSQSHVAAVKEVSRGWSAEPALRLWGGATTGRGDILSRKAGRSGLKDTRRGLRARRSEGECSAAGC
jgi:hypothetical protein